MAEPRACARFGPEAETVRRKRSRRRTDPVFARYLSVSPNDTPLRLAPARRLAAALLLGVVLLLPRAAAAASPCPDGDGQTVRCEAPNALPLAATPAGEAEAPSPADIPLPAPEMLFGVICLVGGLFALIGLMPDFDGWSSGEQDGRRERD